MRWLLFLLLVVGSRAEEWNARNFPNPTAGQFQECKMRTTANICDPDGVLSESARYRLDHDLKQLESRTRQERARSFCDKKGVTAAMAVARKVQGGTTEDVKAMANDMLKRWTLDDQCQKAVVIVVSTEDMKFWVARDDRVPVYADEFTEIFKQQKSLFQQSNYQQALTNILQSTWEKALSKQGTPQQTSGGSQQPSFGGNTQGGGKGSGMGGSGFKMPSIPKWFWLVLIFGVIPLLCCCVCCYCCCCRSKGGGSQPVPQQPYPAAGGGGGGGSGGGGGGMGGFMRTIGGAGVGSMIGNFLSKRGRGGGGDPGFAMGGGGGSAYQGGGAYPAEPQPTYDNNDGKGGHGLYPSAPVKDQGGGGSWA